MFTCNFPDAILQISVIRCYDVAFVLGDPIYYAIISIRSLVHARDSLETRIFHNFQCHFIFLAHFLQLSHNTVRNVGYALGIQTIHHILYDIQFVFDAVMHEIRVDENVIRWTELCVVLEEECGRCLWCFADFHFLWIKWLLLERCTIFCFEP